MRRRGAPRPFAPALRGVADAVMPATLLAEVQRVWPDVTGPAFARAVPHSERAGEVTVRCGSGVLANELDLLGPHVADALNRALGRPAVTRVRGDARPPV
ncbi:MAG: hypothetical protein QOI80_3017 [Solirubrobacteraceae bacterium]|nr:hypothetical protein [Solirubrobacteraceae bacterium]